MKKTYIQPNTKYLVLDSEIMIGINNTTGSGKQLVNSFDFEEEDEEDAYYRRKGSVWE